MTKDEKIIIAVSALLVMTVIIWRKPIVAVVTGEALPTNPNNEVGVSQTPANSSLVKGPSYLMYNQPYAFAPPIGNFLPSITAGQGNQTVNLPTNFAADEYPYLLQ